ncbi:hypothetical protein V8C44DRAFT_251328 [Trichoderma aethiopicum]
MHSIPSLGHDALYFVGRRLYVGSRNGCRDSRGIPTQHGTPKASERMNLPDQLSGLSGFHVSVLHSACPKSTLKTAEAYCVISMPGCGACLLGIFVDEAFCYGGDPGKQGTESLEKSDWQEILKIVANGSVETAAISINLSESHDPCWMGTVLYQVRAVRSRRKWTE